MLHIAGYNNKFNI